MSYSSSSGAYAHQNKAEAQKNSKVSDEPVEECAEIKKPSVFSNRVFAALIAAVLILGSTVFSVNRSLGTKSAEISDSFYTGVTYDGYTHPSISSQLEVCTNAANGIVTLAVNYDGLDTEIEDVRTKRDALINALSNASNDVRSVTLSDVCSRYRELVASVDTLTSKMERLELAERDSNGLAQYKTNFTGAQSVIENAGYNEAVREFIRENMTGFPAEILSEISRVDAPELFS